MRNEAAIAFIQTSLNAYENQAVTADEVLMHIRKTLEATPEPVIEKPKRAYVRKAPAAAKAPKVKVPKSAKRTAKRTNNRKAKASQPEPTEPEQPAAPAPTPPSESGETTLPKVDERINEVFELALVKFQSRYQGKTLADIEASDSRHKDAARRWWASCVEEATKQIGDGL